MNAALEIREPASPVGPRAWWPLPDECPIAPWQGLPSLSSLGLALLDQVDCGLIVCDEQGLVHHGNRSGRDEILHGGLFVADPRHFAAAAGTSGDLATALLNAAQRGRRSLVTMARDDNRLTVTVQPLVVPDLARPLALAMLGRRSPCSALGVEMLGAHHRLTLAERRVLLALTRCRSPREIAAEHGVSLATVRSQVAAIRSKFNVSSVDALLLRTAELPPMACALHRTMAASPMPLAA